MSIYWCCAPATHPAIHPRTNDGVSQVCPYTGVVARASRHPLIHPSTHSSTHVPMMEYIRCAHILVLSPSHPHIHSSTHPSIHSSTHSPIHQPIHPRTNEGVSQVCPHTGVVHQPSSHLLIHPSTHPPTHPPTYQ